MLREQKFGGTVCEQVKRTRTFCKKEIIDLEVCRLIISLEDSASDTSDTEVEDDVESDGQLSAIEDLA
jgi:hypothetical protein